MLNVVKINNKDTSVRSVQGCNNLKQQSPKNIFMFKIDLNQYYQ